MGRGLPADRRKLKHAWLTDEYRHDFLVRLRRARERAGLTQVQAAELMGKPQSFVSKCESGERRVLAFELPAFAKAYGTKVEKFYPAS